MTFEIRPMGPSKSRELNPIAGFALACLFALLLSPGLASAQNILTPLPLGVVGYAVSDDGGVVVGRVSTSQGFGAGIWTPTGGIELLVPTVPGEFEDSRIRYELISGDGSSYVRHFLDPFNTVYALDTPSDMSAVTVAFQGDGRSGGISDDGSEFVASGFGGGPTAAIIGRDDGTRVVIPTPIFDPGGPGELEVEVTVARAASGTSSLNRIVGFFGSFGGTEWPFLWTPASGSNHFMPEESLSNLMLSGSGEYMVGQRETLTGPELFRWTEVGGLESLGSLPIAIDPIAVSDDGEFVLFTTGLWTENTGYLDMETWIGTELGLDLSAWQSLDVIRDMSPDGDWVLGLGTKADPMGDTQSWLLQVPEPGLCGSLALGVGGLAWLCRRRAQCSSGEQANLGPRK